MKVGLCTAPTVTQHCGASRALPFAQREQWCHGEREPLGQGQLPSAPDRAGAWPQGPAVPGAGGAQPGPSALTLPTLCSPRHTVLRPWMDHAGLSTMSSPSFSSSATMPRAPLLHHHLPHSWALQEHPPGAWGGLPRAIGSAALPLSPRDFLPAAPGKASGQGAPVMGLLPPTAEGPSSKKGVLGFTMSTLGTKQ